MSYQETKLMNLEDGQLLLSAIDQNTKKEFAERADNLYTFKDATPGPIVTVDDAVAEAVKQMKIAIEPVQDLHGYDNPWPAGGRKQLIPYPYKDTLPLTKNGVTFTDIGNGRIHAQGTATATTYLFLYGNSITPIPEWVKPNTEYTLRPISVASKYFVQFILYGSTAFTQTGSTFTTPNDLSAYTGFGMVIGINNGAVVNDDISPMLEYGSTASDWQPYSNICPISGWTGAEVTRTGKNLFSYEKITKDAIYRANIAPIGTDKNKFYLTGASGASDNNVLSVANSAVCWDSLSDVFDEDTVVTFSCKVHNFTNLGSAYGFIEFCYCDADGRWQSYTAIENKRFTAVGYTYIVITGTIPAGKKAALRMSPAYSNSNINLTQYTEVEDIQIEKGSAKSVFEPYTINVYPITFPSSAGTVYGGTLTVNADGTGELVVDHKVKTLIGNENWLLEKSDNFYTDAVEDAKIQQLVRCSVFKSVYAYYYPGIENIWISASRRINLTFPEIPHEANALKTFLANLNTVGTPVQVVYELATPVTYTLSTRQVETIIGLNHIWADCGDILSFLYAIEKYHDDRYANRIYNTVEDQTIASFTDGADKVPLKTLTVGIEPVQDLHGYDSPWPAGGRKNILPYPFYSTTRTENGITFTDNGDGSVTINGTATANANFALWVETNIAAGQTLSVASFRTGTVTDGIVGIYDRVGLIMDRGAGDTKTYSNGYSQDFRIQVHAGTTCTNLVLWPMFVLSSTLPTAYVPYSNICPITGRTGAEVTRTGKNLFDPAVLLDGTGWTESDGVYSGDARGIQNVNLLNNLFPYAGQITLSLDCKVNTGRAGYIYVTYSDGTYGLKEITGTDWNHRTFTSAAGKTIIRIHFGMSNAYAMQLKNIQFEFGATETAFAGYTAQTYSIEFPSEAGTVYGGNLTVNADGTGTLVVDRAFETITKDSAWYGFTTGTGNASAVLQLANYQNVKYVTGSANYNGAISSAGKELQNYWVNARENEATYDCGFAYSSSGQLRVHRADVSTITDLASFKSAFPDTQICYPLATPQTYTLSALEVIETLKGNNVLWADTGDIKSVDYPADTKLYIDQRIAELLASINS